MSPVPLVLLTMEFLLDYASLAKKLENQELESPTGRASPQVYGQLLAIYLLFNDLTSAKFLWKRIPSQIKEENSELSIIWLVGKLMWKRNFPEIYAVINSCPSWPNHLKNIMNLISESTRQRAGALISKAYSTISISDASKLLGLSNEETLKIAEKLNWSYEADTGYIVINKPETSNKNIIDNSELLEKLTDYILFLENTSR